ncbi:MAG: HEPN domain-containing protein [Oscillospiraceae bacterium]|nr:HEPN domain-containing protein [Oscillospiraceae bacterium]
MSKKVDYWLDLCDEDLVTAKGLIGLDRLLHAAFFCHLTAEKALKAAVANKTAEIPPKTHDLKRLADLSEVFDELSMEQKDLLKRLTPLHIEGRYPEHKEILRQSLTKEFCEKLLLDTEDFLCWIKVKLEK